MTDVRVELADPWVRPGGPVRARLAWRLPAAPRALVVRLLWTTEGLGERDMGIAASERLPDPGEAGETEVTLEAPTGPYSFVGHLVRLRWLVELAVEPGKTVVQAGLVLAPTPEPIRLHG